MQTFYILYTKFLMETFFINEKALFLTGQDTVYIKSFI